MIRRSLTALFLLAAACDAETFDPRTLLDEPRILALRATPPVLAVDGSSALAALVVDGNGAAVDATVEWRACDPWRFVLDPDADCAPGDSLALPDATLAVEDVVRRFPPPQGELPPPGGAPDAGDDCAEALRLDLPVVAEARVDGRRLVSVKRIPVMLPAPVRTNPVLGPLRMDGASAPTEVPAGAELELSIAPRVDSVDLVCDDDGARPEPVVVFLYATAGALADSQLDVLYGADGSESAELTTWTAPQSGDAVLWFVAIDGDGGTDWASHRLEVR